jgi:outer membrane protein insertion porin family
LLWSDIDDPLDPEVGAKAGLIVEYASSEILSDFSYVKVTGEVAGYYPIIPPVVTAIRGKIGWASPLGGQEQLPLFKRFYSGGTGSIRGVGRRALGPLDPDGDPVGGSRLWEGSIEARYPIWADLGGVVFMDNGWVWPEEEGYDEADFFYTAGFGFRYKSPIGPIGIDFGFPITENDDVQKEILHINIGHAF